MSAYFADRKSGVGRNGGFFVFRSVVQNDRLRHQSREGKDIDTFPYDRLIILGSLVAAGVDKAVSVECRRTSPKEEQHEHD
jgi:hypothetical protein